MNTKDKNRLSRITTRTGDDGTTGLADGTRVKKTDIRIAALGSLDELGSNIGVLLAEKIPTELRQELLQIQNDLFDLGGTLAQGKSVRFETSKLERLDEQITLHNEQLPPLREFILPSGNRAGALSHLTRTVARRAERDLVALAQVSDVPDNAIAYLNRLSDLLFVYARQINRTDGIAETSWQPGNQAEKARETK